MTVLTENIKKPKGIDPRRDRVEAGPWWWRDENGAGRACEAHRRSAGKAGRHGVCKQNVL
jgi:hypothetical protein